MIVPTRRVLGEGVYHINSTTASQTRFPIHNLEPCTVFHWHICAVLYEAYACLLLLCCCTVTMLCCLCLHCSARSLLVAELQPTPVHVHLPLPAVALLALCSLHKHTYDCVYSSRSCAQSSYAHIQRSAKLRSVRVYELYRRCTVITTAATQKAGSSLQKPVLCIQLCCV